MKKILLLCIILFCAMMFVLVFGCVDDSENPSNTQKPSPEQPPELVMGKAANPLIKGDVPDPSILRVGNVYYMVSTTMHFTPVAPIMKSYDLINWRIIGYLDDIIDDIPNYRLETSNTARIGDYGRGQWASSLRYHDGYFYAMYFNNQTTGKSYFYSNKDPENNKWQRWTIDRSFHDPSLFYDETSEKYYILYGQGISIIEMEPGWRGIKEGGIDKVIIPRDGSLTNGGSYGTIEGSQVYHRDGFYYIITISITGGRRVICSRSENIEGPYETRLLLNKGLGSRSGGVAQGGLIETPDGNWYGFFFQDREAVGRVPVLVPMRWGDDGWPVFGDINGNIPEEFDIKLDNIYKQNIFISDEFNEKKLPLAWQWNHNPDNSKWSLTARPGFYRITTGRVDKNIFWARNTLTQRTLEPACEGTIALEPTSMKDGDTAGLWAMGPIGGYAGITQENGEKFIVMNTIDYTRSGDILNEPTPSEKQRAAFTGNRVYIRLNFKFRAPGVPAETAFFSYSLDGESWQNIGTTINIQYNMSLFTGYRFGLFNYAAKEAGGYVDFDYYRLTQ